MSKTDSLFHLLRILYNIDEIHAIISIAVFEVNSGFLWVVSIMRILCTKQHIRSIDFYMNLQYNESISLRKALNT